jgi:2'-5' RNA ligase
MAPENFKPSYWTTMGEFPCPVCGTFVRQTRQGVISKHRRRITSMLFEGDADVADGAMLALVPPQAALDAIHVEDGEPLDQMHITLVYLGKIKDLDKDLIHTVASLVAATTAPMEGHCGGYGVFKNETDVLWASFDVPGIGDLRERLVRELRAAGVEFPDDHGYTPHCTLKYADEGEVLTPPDIVPAAAKAKGPYDKLVLAWGGEWTDIPFTGVPMAKAASYRPPTRARIVPGLVASADDWGTTPVFRPVASPQPAAHAIMHDEPEPALPSTDGVDEDAMAMEASSRSWLLGGSGPSQDAAGAISDSDIAARAAAFVKEGVKSFTKDEQRDLITEGVTEGVRAGNLDSLDIRGTHYEALLDDDLDLTGLFF